MKKLIISLLSIILLSPISHAKEISMRLSEFEATFPKEMKTASSGNYTESALHFQKNDSLSDDSENVYMNALSPDVVLVAKENPATKLLNAVAIIHTVAVSSDNTVMWARYALSDTIDPMIKGNESKMNQRRWVMHSGKARKEGGRSKLINGYSYSYFQLPGTENMVFAIESH
ncbi:hypothetical protein FNH88_19130 [Salmonella enterica subsp. salamae]|nr:hypothetical protein [Salmonella enterica subsp. salamae]HCM1942184.1 hypothetical protein [Salmonella enterica subsp. salamae serovar 30:g,m,s:e,n,x]